MKTFRLQPHEIGYLRLMYNTFAGIDYATANATTLVKARKDAQIIKTIREVQIKALKGLASDYIRAALIAKKLLTNEDSVFCVFDPSPENKDGSCTVMTMAEYRQNMEKSSK